MSQNNDQQYEKQKLLIENLLSSRDLFALCANIISSKYFVPELRNSVQFIMEYYDQYSSIPNPKTISAETGTKFSISEEGIPLDEFDYTAAEMEQFCKQRAVLNEVLNASKYIENGDYGTLTSRLEQAVLVSLQRDLGTSVLENVAERIERRKETRKPISTGMPNVDKILGGGLNRTELMMASANSGGGKSIFLSNLSINVAAQGHDVLYISLELSEDMVADRFETMITGWSKDEKLDRIKETATKVESLTSKGWGKIYVKYMEPESNANDVKAYLKEFELQFKCVPTLLVVDYLDIFGTNERQSFSNVYEKDKASSTQLRAIGNNPHYNMIMATASQQNRGAIDQTEMNQSHIAGGLSKVNIVDIYFSIVMTDAMRAEGVADFSFLKTRSSNGVGKVAEMKWDQVKLKFSSLSNGDDGLKIPKKKSNQNSDNTIPSAIDKKNQSLADLMDMD